MCLSIDSNSFFNQFRDYVVSHRSIAITLLVVGILGAGSLAFGGTGFFSHSNGLPQWFSRAVEVIGQKGALSLFIGGGAIGLSGSALGIALLANKGRTPLHKAIEKKEEMDAFLGPRYLNKPDHAGNRPLHYAVLAGHGVNVLLQQAGIQLDAVNNEGETALQTAIRSKNVAAVREFLALSHYPITTEMVAWAIENGDETCVQALLGARVIQGNWNLPLCRAIEKGKCAIASSILDAVESLDTEDMREAFVYAAAHFHLGEDNQGIFQTMIRRGVDVNAKSRAFEGKTALHVGANRNQVELVTRLLRLEGIDVNIQDDRGETPLDLAMHWPWVEVALQIIQTNKVAPEGLKRAKEVARKSTGCESIVRACAEIEANK